MEILTTLLPVIIDILLIVLLIVGIILVIKCIYIIDKARSIMLNVEEKVNSLNSLFNLVGTVSDKVSGGLEYIITSIEKFFIRLLHKKKDEKLDEEEI